MGKCHGGEGWAKGLRGGHPRRSSPIPASMLNNRCETMIGNTKTPCVYILASGANGTLYIGVTSNLIERVWQHRNGIGAIFTRTYNVHRLVWYEAHESMESAISREKALKKWRRDWKVRMIDESNPSWSDLYDGLF